MGPMLTTDRQAALKAEVDHYLATSTTAMAASERLNPVAEYHTAEHLDAELALFRRSPVIVAHSSELVNPGDYVALDVVGVPVLVVRQANGLAKAFVNLCRHRGAPLATEGPGCERRFTCPYHAWTYTLDGSLKTVPNADGFVGINKADYSLMDLACEERHGLIWVVVTPGVSIDVAASLGELDTEYATWKLDEFVVERSTVLYEQANWKFIIDGFLETYHLRFLHANTVGPYIKSNLGPFASYGPHGRMAIVRERYAGLDQPLDDQFLRDVGLVYQLFPNTIMVWQGEHFERWTLFPVPGHPERSVAHVSLLAHCSRVDETALWDRNWKILLSTVENEDWPVARATQAALSARVAETFVFGRNEPALQHFHAALADQLAL